MHLFSGMDVKGKRAVVIGRSRIVGSPMANLLTWHHATVTLCHSRTANLAQVVSCEVYRFLTLLMLETEFFGFGVNTMPADALAPEVARASAGMVLAV